MKALKLFAMVSTFLGLSACVTPSVAQRTLLETETTAEPTGRAAPSTSAGSLTPTAAAISGEYRGLLSGRRASKVGDTLTVVLDELTRASKDGRTNTNRRSSNQVTGVSSLVDNGVLRNLLPNVTGIGGQNHSMSLSVDGDLRSESIFNGAGNSSASNQFVGTITVTVVEVLANGNLRVAGEKRLAVGTEEEVIRFGGVVSPTNIVRNTVMSSRVADARIEYRGDGETDLAKQPGWFSKLLMRVGPN